jgi:hypothetical protein
MFIPEVRTKYELLFNRAISMPETAKALRPLGKIAPSVECSEIKST